MGRLAFEEENFVIQYNIYDKIVSTPTKFPCLFKYYSWYPGKLADTSRCVYSRVAVLIIDGLILQSSQGG